jgi:hypothetical protein
VRQEDLNDESVINRIENTSKSIFLSLCDILQTQSDLRQVNISRKRQRGKQSGISLDMEVSQTTQITFGTLSTHLR